MTMRILSAAAAFSLISMLASTPAVAQDSKDELWTAEQSLATARSAGPAAPTVYRMNHAVLERIVASAPAEGAVARGAGARISVPTPDGDFVSFRIEESSVMAPELARKYPEIATFRGQGADDPAATVRFSRTPLGFQATVVSTDGVFMVAPESPEDTSRYVSRRIEGELDVLFECLAGAFAPDAGKSVDFGPIVALGMADFIEAEHVIAQGDGSAGPWRIVTEPSHGHTPGHVHVCIESGGQRAVITGDLMHHPMQCAMPHRDATFDMDKDAGRQSRLSFVEKYRDSGVVVIGAHFFDPTAGHIETDAKGETWFHGLGL